MAFLGKNIIAVIYVTWKSKEKSQKRIIFEGTLQEQKYEGIKVEVQHVMKIAQIKSET